MPNLKVKYTQFPVFVSVAILLWFAPAQAVASDPLDDLDGTEGWDQVAPTKPRQKKRDLEAERAAFKQEVENWEEIRQLWQWERERYVKEKSNHQRLQIKLKKARLPEREADITEDNLPSGGDWGDQPGDSWFESSGVIDQAIDAELGESGAVPSARPAAARKTRTAAPVAPTTNESDSVDQSSTMPDTFRESTAEQEKLERERREEEAAREEARRLLEEKRERERQAELERKRREEEERRRKAEEAAAGEAAAEALLKQAEERKRKEQEAIREKADLEVDDEGQVVDPELKAEMDEEPGPEEEGD